jgi:peptidoglycan-N-acetylglucosamine deacetylase
MRRLLAVVGMATGLGLAGFLAQAAVVKHGPAGCRGVALTFDLCPVRDRPGFDAPLVDLLIEKQIPATFFVSGRWAVRHEEALKKILGVPFFEVGTHGQIHAHLPELDEEAQRREIEDAVAVLRDRYGRRTVLFRPPYGDYDERTVRLVDALGLRFILWSVVSGDPDPALSREAIARTVTEQTRRGGIIIFHANGKGRETRGVIEDVSPGFAERGLRPMTVSALLDACDDGRNGTH